MITAGSFSAPPVQWAEPLYSGSTHDYFEEIHATAEANSLLLVGHNPKVEDLARRLCGNASVRMPTGGLICFEQPANEWSQIKPGMATLRWMMIPKLLRSIIGD